MTFIQSWNWKLPSHHKMEDFMMKNGKYFRQRNYLTLNFLSWSLHWPRDCPWLAVLKVNVILNVIAKWNINVLYRTRKWLNSKDDFQNLTLKNTNNTIQQTKIRSKRNKIDWFLLLEFPPYEWIVSLEDKQGIQAEDDGGYGKSLIYMFSLNLYILVAYYYY